MDLVAEAAPVAESVATKSAESSDSPAESQPFRSWPDFGASQESPSVWDESSKEETVALKGEQAEPSQSVEDVIASWSAGAAVVDAVDDERSTDTVQEVVESGQETEPGAATAEEPSAYNWLDSIEELQPADQSDTAIAPAAASDVAATEDLSSIAWDLEAAPEVDTVLPVPVPAESAEAPAEAAADPAARAEQLVDELKSLIPVLSGTAGSDGAATGTVAAELEAVIASGAAESEAFQSLRAAVATAQARPRDVDIMLDLVSRADMIAAVIAAHDRYLKAINEAVASLRGDKPEEPAPRW